MKRNLLSAALSLLAALSPIASAQGFQGLQWGANVAAIKRAFPSARPEAVAIDELARCDNADGSTQKCSVARRMCQTMEMSCYPALQLSDYQVGTHRFRVAFNLSKSERLSSVDLTLKVNLVNEPVRSAERAYATLYDSLERKYGAPHSAEAPEQSLEYPCSSSVGCIFVGIARWRTKDTMISLRTSGRYDRGTMRFVAARNPPNLSISYSRLIDDAANSL